MEEKNVWQREWHAIVHGQSVRFRILKYLIIVPLFALLYRWQGREVALYTLGALLVLSLGVHLLFRYKTNGWRTSWGPYRPKKIRL